VRKPHPNQGTFDMFGAEALRNKPKEQKPVAEDKPAVVKEELKSSP